MGSQEGPPEGALGEKNTIEKTQTQDAPKDTRESTASKTDPKSSSLEKEGEENDPQDLTDPEPSSSEEEEEDNDPQELTEAEKSKLTTKQKFQLTALTEAGIHSRTACRFITETYDCLSRKEYRALKENTSIPWSKLGFAMRMRELRGYRIAVRDADSGTLLKHLEENPTAITLRHIDTIARDPTLFEPMPDALVVEVAKAWVRVRGRVHRPHLDIRATNRQYKALEEYFETYIEDATVHAALAEPVDLGPDATGLDFWDGEPSNTYDPPRYDETKLDRECSMIRKKLKDHDSLTPSQLKWLSQNIRFAKDFTEYEIEKVGECRVMQILLQEGNPRKCTEGTPYSSLDKWLIKNSDWESIVRIAESLKRMIQLLKKANSDPLNSASWERDKIPPTEGLASEPNDYFELTIFEQYFQSHSREQSAAADKESGAYSGTQGTGLEGPRKGLPRIEDGFATAGEEPDADDLLACGQERKIEGTVTLLDNPTYPGSANELSVIASYQGRSLRTEEGTKVRVELADKWFIKVWRDRSDGHRVPNPPMRVVRKKTRLCNLLEPQENAEQLGSRLPLQAPTEDDPCLGLYSGICCLNGQLVYMYPVKDKTKEPNKAALKKDDLTGIEMRCEPSQKLSGKNTILHEACVVPGNLRAMKKYIVSGNQTRFRDEPHPIRAIIEQNKRARLQLSPVPLQNTSISSDEGHPDLSTVYLRNGNDIMFTLRLLPIGAYAIPQELVVLTKMFLAAHPLDPMSVNTALQAMGIWLNIQRSDQLSPELAAYPHCDSRKVIAHPVPPVELEVFVLGFPHFLRYTEGKRMTRHPHPYRLISTGYRLDVKAHRSHMVPSRVLDVDRIGQLFDEMMRTARGLPADLTVPVLPASLPGSAIKWPTGVQTGEPPSRDLFSLCLLDDIRTLGLPSYHARSEDTQLVGVPEPIARNFGLSGPSLYVDVVPITEFWNPNTQGQLVCLSGIAETIGPVFKAVKGSAAKARYDATGLLNEKDPKWLTHILPQPVEALMSRPAITAIAKRNSQRLELAQRMGKKTSELKWDPADMVLTWDGAVSEVVRAVGSGELPAARNPDPMDLDEENEARTPAPEDKEGQGDSALFSHDPTTTVALSTEHAEMLLKILDGKYLLAVDWEPLRELLSAKRPIRKNVITLTHRIYYLLFEEVIKAGTPFWKENPREEEPNPLAMKSAHDHFARMVGAVTHTEKKNVTENWESVYEEVPDDEQELWEALEATILPLKNPKPKTWKRVMLSLEEVYTSPLFTHQISAMMKLLAFLEKYPDNWPEGFVDPSAGRGQSE